MTQHVLRSTALDLESGLSRRGLIAGAAGLVAGSAMLAARPARAQGGPALPPNQAVGRPMPELEKEFPVEPGRRLGWAIVGLGKFALNQIIPSFAESRSSKLVALVSGDRDKAQRVASRYGVAAKNVYDYQNFSDIADNDEIDVVYIILPNGLHAEFSIAAAKAGKHVMCEKPMANTIEECEAMIRASDEAGRKLMIAYRAQYEPYNLELIRLAQSGELGDLRLVTSDHGRLLDPKDAADQWRMSKALAGGGSLYDIGIYSLQAARTVTGEEPIEISASIHTPKDDPRFREIEDLVAFRLRFPSGTTAHCTSSYSYAPVKRIQVFGSKATLTLDPATDYYEHKMMLKTEKEDRQIKVKDGNQFALEMDHLSNAIMKNETPKTPGEEGLQDVRLMQAIYKAAETGETIKLDATGATRKR